MNIPQTLSALAGHIKANALELYTLLFLSIGLPTVALIYADWSLAITVFILTQISLGIFAVRNSK